MMKNELTWTRKPGIENRAAVAAYRRPRQAFGPSAVMEFLLSAAELRPPFLLGRAISFENSLLPGQQRKRQREFDEHYV